MADEDGPERPSEDDELAQLELPTLFRRRKKSKKADRAEPSGVAEPAPDDASPKPADGADTARRGEANADATSAAVDAPAVSTRTPVEDESTAAEESVPTDAGEPAAQVTAGPSPRSTGGADTATPEPTSPEPGAEPEPDTGTRPDESAAVRDDDMDEATQVIEPDAAAGGTAAGRGEADVPTRVEAPGAWEPSGQAETETAPLAVATPAREDPAEPSEPAEPEQPKVPLRDRVDALTARLSELRLPALAGHVAAAITGAVVGLVGVGLVVLSQNGCEAVRGTSNCGTAGLFLVLGVVALMVVMGALALAAWRQPSPTSTSFLGVGVIAVIVLLLLTPVLESWFMLIVMPVLGAAAFALAWYVSNRLGPEALAVNEEYSRETHR